MSTTRLAQLLGFSLLCAACGSGEAPTRATAQSSDVPGVTATSEPAHDGDTASALGKREPKIGTYGGTLRVAALSDPKRYNPITAAESSTRTVTQFVFEGLTTLDPFTGGAVPQLAESWEHSEDGTEWTFRLRTDVTWSDGVPFTSADVLFTLGLIFDPKVQNSYRFILTVDGEPITATAPDAHTVVFKLPSPYAPFERAAGFTIVPRHKLEAAQQAGEFDSAWGVDTPPEEIVGTGPFIFTDYQASERIVLQRNPNYWMQDAAGNTLPYIERVVFSIVQNIDVALLKFQQGEIDYFGMRGKDYQILKPQEREGNFTVYEAGATFGSSFAFFNLNNLSHPETGKPYVTPYKSKWFRDKRFRQAVAHAIDKESIIDIVMYGLGYPQWGPMGPSAGYFYNPNTKQYPYDFDAARALLKDMGIEDRDGNGVLEDADGNEIEFSFTTNSGNDVRVDIAQIIRKDLEELGMKVHFSEVEFNTLIDQYDHTYDWEMSLMGLSGSNEPHFGKNVWDSSGTVHMWFPKQETPSTPWEARINEIFNQGVAELDQEKRKALYDEWQMIVSEELPLIYTCLSESLSAVRNRFGNFYTAPAATTPFSKSFHNIEELYILDDES